MSLFQTTSKGPNPAPSAHSDPGFSESKDLLVLEIGTRVVRCIGTIVMKNIGIRVMRCMRTKVMSPGVSWHYNYEVNIWTRVLFIKVLIK